MTKFLSHQETLKREWAEKFKPLIGRKIVLVRYLTEGECRDLCISKASIVLQLDDGALLYPMADDEGNDGGALGVCRGSKTSDLPDGGAPTI